MRAKKFLAMAIALGLAVGDSYANTGSRQKDICIW